MLAREQQADCRPPATFITEPIAEAIADAAVCRVSSTARTTPATANGSAASSAVLMKCSPSDCRPDQRHGG